jgi:glycosyltransferase involved in cell wall biosynthesis
VAKKPRIGIVTHAYPCFEGDFRANFIEALAKALAEFADVTVFVPYTANWQRPLGLSVIDTGCGTVTVHCYKYLPFKSWHTLGMHTLMKGDLTLHWFRVLAVPVMVVCGIWQVAKALRRDAFQMLQAHWAIPNTFIALAGRWLAGKRGSSTKVFTAFPGSDVTVLKTLGPLTRLVARCINWSNFLSCNSTDLKEDLVAAGIPAERIDLVIYGIDDRRLGFEPVARRQFRQRFGAGDEHVVLLLVGRFVPKKGFSLVFEALPQMLAEAPDIWVWVVGEGPEEQRYRAILQANACSPKVNFLGTLPVQELYLLYSAVDILLMPSQRLPSDGLNVVVPEAMATGRPVIATWVGGNHLVVFDGENGFLHAPNDMRTMVMRTVELCKNAQLRTRMGDAAVRLARERFTWRHIARYYLSRVEEKT